MVEEKKEMKWERGRAKRHLVCVHVATEVGRKSKLINIFLLFLSFAADAGSGQSENKLQSGGGTSGERIFLNISETN